MAEALLGSGPIESLNEWLVDSGTTHHMCNTRNQLKKVEESSVKRVVLGNATSSKVSFDF